MKNLSMYSSKFIHEVKDEETGEIITEAHSEKTIVTIPLDNILKINVEWSGIEVLRADGTITEYKDIDEIYFS